MNVGNKVKFKQFGNNGDYVIGQIVEFYEKDGMDMCVVESLLGETWYLAVAFVELLK